ncbi:Fe-S cluster assembly protein SufD [Aliikangiella sp. IMCC44359]|uniref:Fe-S cluster assembly protein SufD n=1 Tax=Aliikangiella sp. IMCC44359 TaxID=3459125 RepID=UPI00403B3876
MSFSIEFKNREALTLSQFDLKTELNWMQTLKKKCLSEFQNKKLPNRKVEHWKYNEISFLAQHVFELAKQPNQTQLANVHESTKKIELTNAIEITFVNGYLVSPLSKLESIEGLRITSFDNANAQQQELILSQLSENCNSKNLLLDLNQLTSQSGLLIEVERNHTINQPIYINYLNSEHDKNCITSQQTLISLAQSSEITVIEQFDSNNQNSETLALQQTFITAKENSVFNHYRLNLEPDSARQVSQVQTCLHQDSILNSFYLGLGSKLNRTDIDVIHKGENAECNLTGIYLPAKSQTIDYHTNIEHQVPRCNTNEIFRGIIADKASATFNGKIHIFQDAQKSDAYLNNKNLLLTNEAEINTKPELEIYADDVSCAHGATVAQLDNKSLYYLQTRGINALQAKKMLSLAFIQELLNTIKNVPVQTFLSTLLDDYMSRVA